MLVTRLVTKDVLDGAQVDQNRNGVVMDRREIKAYRVGDWKLIRYPNNIKTELYNLANDPLEKENLAASQPERVKEMSAAFKAILKAKGHRFLK